MKQTLLSAMVCLECSLIGAGAVPVKEKSKNPRPIRYEAMLSSSSLPRPWLLDLVIEELSTDDEMRDLAQAYAKGGERALDKAMENLNRGYCDLGVTRLPIMVARSSLVEGGRRIDVVLRWNTLHPLSRALGGSPEYPYVYLKIQVDEHGKGKGSLTSQSWVRFNGQGQIVVQTNSTQHFDLTMVHLVN